MYSDSYLRVALKIVLTTAQLVGAVTALCGSQSANLSGHSLVAQPINLSRLPNKSVNFQNFF